MNTPQYNFKQPSFGTKPETETAGVKQNEADSSDDESSTTSDIGMPVPMKRTTNPPPRTNPDVVPAKVDTGEDSPWDSDVDDDDVDDIEPQKVVPAVEPLKSEPNNDAVRPSKGKLICIYRTVLS